MEKASGRTNIVWTADRIDRLGDIIATLYASAQMMGKTPNAEDQAILDDAWITICRAEAKGA